MSATLPFKGLFPSMTGLSAGARLAGLGLAWLVGVACQLQQSTLSDGSVYAALAAVGGCGLLLGWRWPALQALAWAGVGGLAFALAGWHASAMLADRLSADLEGDDLVVVGVVAAMPQSNDSGVRFRFKVEQATRATHPGSSGVLVAVPSLLSLGWSRNVPDEVASSPPPPANLTAGQRWRLAVRLRRPHGSVNPHGFDYELWLFEQGLRATGHVHGQGTAAATLIDSGHGYRIERLRQQVRDAVLGHVGDARAAGVLAALAVGDQAAIVVWCN